MKKRAIILAFLVCLTTAWAQQKDTLQINVNNNEMVIYTSDINSLSKTDYNAIIGKITNETNALAKEYQTEVERINKLEKNGDITSEKAQELRKSNDAFLATSMEALTSKIERWADEYGESLHEDANNADDWAKQWEYNAEKYETINPPDAPTPPATDSEDGNTVVVINDDGISVTGNTDWDPDDIKEARSNYKRNQTIGYFDMYFGWNNWVNGDGFAVNQTPENGEPNATAELNFWPSMVWGFGFGGKSRMGTSKLYVRYGAQFNWHYFQLKGNTIVNKMADPNTGFDGVSFVQDNTKNYSKSSFRMVYLDVPVMLEFDSSKPGRSNGFSLGVGGYGGVRLSSKTKVYYSDFNGDKTKVKQNNNYYTNGFRYGLLGQIGFGTFKITAKYDMNELFRDDRTTPDYQIASLTLGWVFP